MGDSSISFDEVVSIEDPLLSFKWLCNGLPQFSNMPLTYVEAVGIPFPNMQQKEGVFAAGTRSFYPGFEEISAFDMTFYEDRRLTTTKWLEAWRRSIRDPGTGLYYLPGNYKRTMVFTLVDQKNTKLCNITLINCWPTARGNFDLQYTDSSRQKVQQNFSVDGQEIEFLV